LNSREKGKRGEREWAECLRSMGFKNARRGQQFSGSPESPDVVGGIPMTHAEVKRVQALNISVAMGQAARDAGSQEIPYVAHRRNGEEWLVTVKAKDLIRLAKQIVNHQCGTSDSPTSAPNPVMTTQASAKSTDGTGPKGSSESAGIS
jgi:Holliday junction resolvase